MSFIILEDDELENVLWTATYFLPNLSSEIDDDMEETAERSAEIEAPDFDTAYRYAEQYMRKQASENDIWKYSELVSLYRK